MSQVTIKVSANYPDTLYFYPDFPIVNHLEPYKMKAREGGYDPFGTTVERGYTMPVAKLLSKLTYPRKTPGILDITISMYQLTVVYAHGFSPQKLAEAIKELFVETYGACTFVTEGITLDK